MQLLKSVVCDLDGTLLHTKEEEIAVPGRTTRSFLSGKSARLLASISRIVPVVIATGRNSASVFKLVKQLPYVRFGGFVLENGFVVRRRVKPESIVESRWNRVAELFPEWERLPNYEGCAGFIFSPYRNGITGNAVYKKKKKKMITSIRSGSDTEKVFIDGVARYAGSILESNGYDYTVYKERRKLFIYPGQVDKMRGLARIGVHPYIAMGDGLNDFKVMQYSDCPVTLISGAPELRGLAERKGGFLSGADSHSATHEMLQYAYEKIRWLKKSQLTINL